MVKRIGIACALFISIAVALLSISVLLLPKESIELYQNDAKLFFRRRETREEAERKLIASRYHKRLGKQIELYRAARRNKRHQWQGKPYGTVIGFYSNWDPNSFTSFRQHIDALSYVMPIWFSLTTDDNIYRSLFSTAARDPEVVSLARENNLPVVPVLNNVINEDFRWEPMRQLLADRTRQEKMAYLLRDYLLANHFAGINIDLEAPYEDISPAQLPEARRLLHHALPQFVLLLKSIFAPVHLLVTQDLSPEDPYLDYQALAEANDFVILMLYDQHSLQDPPGPIASQTWIEERADKLFRVMDSSKVVIGLGNYGYDWPIKFNAQGYISDAGPARSLQLGPALNIANTVHASIQMDDEDLNPYFTYQDTKRKQHIVYLLDAITAYNTIVALRGYTPRGAALWHLGSEDPAIWSFFDEAKLTRPATPAQLARIVFPSITQIETATDEDELTQLAALPVPGVRKFTTDDDGLIVSERYLTYPTPLVLRQFPIEQQKTVALTFDDGPDPRYTPQIMRILKQYGVRATFFIVGENAARYPGIVQRCWDEGHELGNHTYSHPHTLLISSVRTRLEINATQSLIESLTGHVSLLFRPPYGDSPDASMDGTRDTALQRVLQQDGYVTVGMNIDPQDYLQPNVATILRRIRKQLPGNHIILLHDSGGDRIETVRALPMIIRSLRADGYQFSTVSQLIGPEWQAKLFPAVTPRWMEITEYQRYALELWSATDVSIHLLFFIAICLGIARIVGFAPLALLQRIRTRRAVHNTPAYQPPVTVAIPAYNEERVVGMTVESVLASDYPDFHVIVIDDGSTDGTWAELQTRFASDKRVTLLHQQNGGKSSALNEAFNRAQTEIVVCLDADTTFEPSTIRHLVAPFADSRVGAVAGNIKVGNRINLLTIWQSIEYITNQNFDRSAYAVMNAVPVIPGAVSAWRRSAVISAGGFDADTLAEDCDLTFKIRLLGYHTCCANNAIAHTEVPDTPQLLAKQRFRWAFGILQVLWKHKHNLLKSRYGAFSMVVMPTMWIYNFFLLLLAPVIDLAIAHSLMDGEIFMTAYYAASFFVLDLGVSILAFRLAHEDYRQLAWLFWQRFFYRQLLYYIITKALLAAVRGSQIYWWKIRRKATITMPRRGISGD